MSARIDGFSRMTAVGVCPIAAPAPSAAVRFSPSPLKASLRPDYRAIPYRRGTSRTGENWMARRTLTVDRHEEIKRHLADGRSVREIAAALSCSRRLVRQIRDGERLTHETAASPDPLWISQLEWPVMIHELGLGFAMRISGRSARRR